MRTKVNRKYLPRKNYYVNKIKQQKDDLKTTWKLLTLQGLGFLRVCKSEGGAFHPPPPS